MSAQACTRGVATPEGPPGPGQGQSSAVVLDPSSNTVATNNPFLYPLYPCYPLTTQLTSMLRLPPTIPPPPPPLTNPLPTHTVPISAATEVQSTSRPRKKASQSRSAAHCPLKKAKTLDLSLKNSRGELESLVRWIGGDSMEITHRCSQTASSRQHEPQWQCTCRVALPSSTGSHAMNPSHPVTLQSVACDSKKKEAIKSASKLMIKEILKQPLPISIDLIGEDGNVTFHRALTSSPNHDDDRHDRHSNNGSESECEAAGRHSVRHRKSSIHKTAGSPSAAMDHVTANTTKGAITATDHETPNPDLAETTNPTQRNRTKYERQSSPAPPALPPPAAGSGTARTRSQHVHSRHSSTSSMANPSAPHHPHPRPHVPPYGHSAYPHGRPAPDYYPSYNPYYRDWYGHPPPSTMPPYPSSTPYPYHHGHRSLGPHQYHGHYPCPHTALSPCYHHHHHRPSQPVPPHIVDSAANSVHPDHRQPDGIEIAETKDDDLFAQSTHEMLSVGDGHETDDGDGRMEVSKVSNAGNPKAALPTLSEKNPSSDDEDSMNEMKQEEVSVLERLQRDKAHRHSLAHDQAEAIQIEHGGGTVGGGPDKATMLGNESAVRSKGSGSTAATLHRVENEMKMNEKHGGPHGEEKEMEGGFAVPPQRLLVLVPQSIEYKTITGILPCNTQRFTFSKKFNISGVVCPPFTHLPDSNEHNESMQEAPGEQNRLYIVQCGTGLVAPSMSIATVVQTVGIDAILLLGSAVSLQPKSIKPGHLLLPNSVIQHDLCPESRNGAIFKTNGKLSEWLRTLITNGSGKENESLPFVIGSGTLLSGSEIIRTESRIQYLSTCLSTRGTPNEEDTENEAVEEEDDDTEDAMDGADDDDERGRQQAVQGAQEQEVDGVEEEDDADLYCDEVMAVDRESISVAIICRRLRIPFVTLKTIAPPRMDMTIDFRVYDNCEMTSTFDCNAAIPLVRALLRQYTAVEY